MSFNLIGGIRGFFRGFFHGYGDAKDERLRRGSEEAERVTTRAVRKEKSSLFTGCVPAILVWEIGWAVMIVAALMMVYGLVAFIKWCWYNS